jgi:hypothetical protein
MMRRRRSSSGEDDEEKEEELTEVKEDYATSGHASVRYIMSGQLVWPSHTAVSVQEETATFQEWW